ncbi:MAG: 4Fe-4S binding protein [Desulfohalobiaceae bacterium]|nr:4Fe-4S binding protein [Desulfohalobiaceae bacterium]
MGADAWGMLRVCVQAPEWMEPWLDRFYDRSDRDLVLSLRDRPQEPAEVRESLGCRQADLVRAWQRGVLAWSADDRLSPADFHVRFDHWAMFEGWKDLPQAIKDRLNRWELGQYAAAHAGEVEALRSGLPPQAERIIPRYLLFGESLETIDLAEQVFLWPCNCRSMLGKCSKPVFTCLRFDNARGLGWEISREKAKDLIQEANRAGLMQSGELGLDAEGRLAGAICNCCSDCCFPHLLAEAVQAEKLWPKTRYLARINHDLCSGCGRCARRCPFQALTLTKAAQDETREVVLSETICRGCGLCATGCPEQAITMHSLDVGPGWDMRELLG